MSLFKTSTGSYYLPSSAPTDIITNAIRNNQVFDSVVYDIAKLCIKKDTIVLDIGSNFGQMAILMSTHVGNDGCVHAFESNKFVYSILEKNIKINNAKVIPHFGAVYKRGVDYVNLELIDGNNFVSYGSYGINFSKPDIGDKVSTIVIDDLVFQKNISFMKIDTQGADLCVLQGAYNTIMKHRMPIIFEFWGKYQYKNEFRFYNYLDFLTLIDYKIFHIDQPFNHFILPSEFMSDHNTDYILIKNALNEF